MMDNQTKDSLILGQKYAFATASLILGICSYVNLLGLEKPILAIVFGWLALRAQPGPRLTEHRVWAKAGMVLAEIVLIGYRDPHLTLTAAELSAVSNGTGR